jgi:hypothetical protein
MLRQAAKETLEGLIVVERGGRQSDATVRFVAGRAEVATQAGELRGARAVRLRLDSFVAAVTGRPVPAVPGQLEIEGFSAAVAEMDTDEDDGV